MASKAKPLKDEIKSEFYPWVTSKGFVKQKSSDPYVTEFVRQSPEGEDVFDIQWDKYWRPYFVLNFEKRGLNEGAWANHGRLQRTPGGSLSCWFSVYPPMIYRLLKLRWRYRPPEVVEELKEAFEELEAWWNDNRQIGPHIYMLEYHA